MPRIRTIKPEFFTSLTMASVHLEARLTFIGLWTHVDDEGRCVDDARLVKAALWPLDDRTAADVDYDLRVLTESSLIARYEVGGRRYLAVTGWHEHQRINRPTPSRIPAPPSGPPPPPPPTNGRSEHSDHAFTDGSVSGHGALTTGSGSGKGKDHHREAVSRPARAVVEALGCDDDDGQWIADEINRRHRPRKLVAYIRSMAEAGDLAPLLAERHQAAAGAPVTTVEPACGGCGPNRLVELPDGRAARCPVCHPLRVREAS